MTTTLADDCAPTVHLNGTGKKQLMDGYRAALHALKDAQKALCDIAPHGRDFYVNADPAAFQKARHAHERRLQAIDTCIHEIEALGIAVIDQGKN